MLVLDTSIFFSIERYMIYFRWAFRWTKWREKQNWASKI